MLPIQRFQLLGTFRVDSYGYGPYPLNHTYRHTALVIWESEMASIRYFSGDRELTAIRFEGGNSTLASNFSGFPEGVEPVFVVGAGWTGRVRADRKVEYKSSPSRHQCDDRCLNATGRTMKCECSCGGKNHGRGAFMCEAA